MATTVERPLMAYVDPSALTPIIFGEQPEETRIRLDRFPILVSSTLDAIVQPISRLGNRPVGVAQSPAGRGIGRYLGNCLFAGASSVALGQRNVLSAEAITDWETIPAGLHNAGRATGNGGPRTGFLHSIERMTHHRRIPGSRLEIIENCGHHPELEATDRFVRLVEDFLA